MARWQAIDFLPNQLMIALLIAMQSLIDSVQHPEQGSCFRVKS
jgi:hypothetical protein